MPNYSKGEILELLKIEVKDGHKTFTTDIFTLINLISNKKIIKEDVILTKYHLKIDTIIPHEHDYFGYTGILVEQCIQGRYEPINDCLITLSCQKEYYERHRYFLAGLTDYNPYDYYWVNREHNKYSGVYFTVSDFIDNHIVNEYQEFASFLV